jgi:hypothetical protein
LRQGQQQRLADVDGLKAVLRICHPLVARNADVVDAHHRQQTPQGQRLAEKDDARERRSQTAFGSIQHAQGFQHVFIVISQFFGLSVDTGANAPISGNGDWVKVIQAGIGQYGLVWPMQGLALAAQHPQIVIDATLVTGTDTAICAGRQAGGFQIDRLLRHIGFRHVHH